MYQSWVVANYFNNYTTFVEDSSCSADSFVSRELLLVPSSTIYKLYLLFVTLACRRKSGVHCFSLQKKKNMGPLQ